MSYIALSKRVKAQISRQSRHEKAGNESEDRRPVKQAGTWGQHKGRRVQVLTY